MNKKDIEIERLGIYLNLLMTRYEQVPRAVKDEIPEFDMMMTWVQLKVREGE